MKFKVSNLNLSQKLRLELTTCPGIILITETCNEILDDEEKDRILPEGGKPEDTVLDTGKGWNPLPGRSNYPITPAEVTFKRPVRVGGVKLQGDTDGNSVSRFSIKYATSGSAAYKDIPVSEADTTPKVRSLFHSLIGTVIIFLEGDPNWTSRK